MPLYQGLIHVSGLHIESVDDDDIVVGCFTARKTRARGIPEAKHRIRKAFEREPKVQELFSISRENGTTPEIGFQEIYEVSLWHYLFGSYCRGMVFYPAEHSTDSHQPA